jgi:hypothetical protein
VVDAAEIGMGASGKQGLLRADRYPKLGVAEASQTSSWSSAVPALPPYSKGRRSLDMTLRYARIANRTVADEYFAVTEKVEALYGQGNRYPPPPPDRG